jgi:hypothetical protein
MNNKERFLFTLAILSLVGLGLFISILINKKNRKIEVGDVVKYIGNDSYTKNWCRGKLLKVHSIENLCGKKFAYFRINKSNTAIYTSHLKLVR